MVPYIESPKGPSSNSSPKEREFLNDAEDPSLPNQEGKYVGLSIADIMESGHGSSLVQQPLKERTSPLHDIDDKDLKGSMTLCDLFNFGVFLYW